MSERVQEIDAAGEKKPAGVLLQKLHDPSYITAATPSGEWVKEYVGRVFFSDDLETATPLNWAEIGGAGSGTAVARDTGKAAHGGASLKISTKTSGQAEDDSVQAERKTAIGGGLIVRFKSRFLIDDLDKNKMMVFWLQYFDGATLHQAKIQFDTENLKWQYLNSSNAWVDIGGGDSTLAEGVFHWFEMDVDFTLDKYLRFMATGLAKVLNYPVYTVADAVTAKHLSCVLETTALTTDTATAYYDDINCLEIGE